MSENPYQAPESMLDGDQPVVHRGKPSSRYYFKDPRRLGRSVQVFVGLCAVANVVVAVLLLDLDVLLERVSVEEDIPLNLVMASYRRINAANGTYMLLSMVATIVFLVWVFRVTFNARSLPTHNYVKTPPGWAVGGYFVPPVFLWLPCQSMRQVWRASQEAAGRPHRLGLVSWWWGWCMLLGVFLVGVGVVVSIQLARIEEPGLAELQLPGRWQVATELVALVGLVLWGLVVGRLSRLQTEAHAKTAGESSAGAEQPRVEPAADQSNSSSSSGGGSNA